ncbi:hypothetical protein ACP70R_040028 [Stipagrostis hirtigluma subsp. patula]
MENNASNPQQPPPGLPDGGFGAAGCSRRREEEGGDDQAGRGQLHRGMPGRALLLLALRALLRLINKKR